MDHMDEHMHLTGEYNVKCNTKNSKAIKEQKQETEYTLYCKYEDREGGQRGGYICLCMLSALFTLRI